MKSRTAKGGSWNKERYSNKPYLCMQNCQGFELTWDPSGSPDRLRNPKQIGKYSRKLAKIEPVEVIIFGAFWYHLGGFGCILAAI